MGSHDGVRVRFSVALEDQVGDDAPVDGLVQGRGFTIFPAGETHAIDGRVIRFEANEAMTLLGNLVADEELPVTYDHEQDRARGGEAAGWMQEVGVEGGDLRCKRVGWTVDAAAEIRAKKWRYISGDALGSWDDDGGFRPRTLLAASLTNKPAIRGMGSVRLSVEAPAAPQRPKEGHRMLKKETFALLGLADSASEDAIHEAFTSKLAAVEASVEGCVKAAVEATEAKFRAEAEARGKAEKVKALVGAAVRDGKVAVAGRDAFEALANADLAAAEAFVAAAPKVAPTALTVEPGPAAGAEGEATFDLTTEAGRKGAAKAAEALAAKEKVSFSVALARLIANPKK